MTIPVSSEMPHHGSGRYLTVPAANRPGKTCSFERTAFPSHADFLDQATLEFDFLQLIAAEPDELAASTPLGRPMMGVPSITSPTSSLLTGNPWQPSRGTSPPSCSSSRRSSSLSRSSASTLSYRSSSMSSVATMSSISSTSSRSSMSTNDRGPVSRPAKNPRYTQPGKISPPSKAKLLPLAVHNSIFQELAALHENSADGRIALAKDLCSVNLTSKSWAFVARRHLYGNIMIRESELLMSPKVFWRPNAPSTVKTLRRTLRARADIAKSVRDIFIWRDIAEPLSTGKAMHGIAKNLASLVMECPDLERLTGYYPTYHHSFDWLLHALSTRTKLKEHVWRIGTAACGWDKHSTPPSTSGRNQNRDLAPEQAVGLLTTHAKWLHLETLIVDCDESGQMGGSRLFAQILSLLPSLKHLFLSSVSAADFNDTTLRSLPHSICSLRLQNMDGVTEEGLVAHYTDNRSLAACASLRNLSLVNLPEYSMAGLAFLLGHLHRLQRLTVLGHRAIMDASACEEDVMYPILASQSLCYIHWDFAEPEFPNAFLATSIKGGSLPRLQALRVLFDPDGSLQAVCRPFTSASKKGPYRQGHRWNTLVEGLSDRGRCAGCSAARSAASSNDSECDARSLIHAREAAYLRAEQALQILHQSGRLASARRQSISKRYFEFADGYEEEHADDEVLGWSRSRSRSSGDSSRDDRDSLRDSDFDTSDRNGPTAICVVTPTNEVLEHIRLPSFLGSMGPTTPVYLLEPDIEGSDEMLSTMEDLIENRKFTDVRRFF